MSSKYVKHGAGLNDHKKGNRTKGPRAGAGENANITGLTKYSNDLHEMTEHYKKIAETRRNSLKYGQDFAAGLHDRMEAYINEQLNAGKGLTVAGLIRASEMCEDRFYRALAGDYDHLCYEALELRGLDPDEYEGARITEEDGTELLFVPLSDLIKSARLVVQEQREEYAIDKKNRNAAGPIFLLKSAHGFKEDAEPKTQNNTLIVAPEEQIKAALQRLG